MQVSCGAGFCRTPVFRFNRPVRRSPPRSGFFSPAREFSRQNRLPLTCSFSDGQNEANEFSPEEDFDEPENARQAIRYGLESFGAMRYDEALKLFNQALELPGSGIKQFKNKPAKISTAEKTAALYNIACCHSATDKSKEGLLAIGACLALGYDDFNQLRTDQDLVTLREDPRFEPLLQRYEPKQSKGLLGGLMDGFSGR
ncbi:hypothetical protein BSKO_05709 [Bryopsis sp. KO-2023]|nr:hypothetical protein BSKO_05709 [Bryopsis sp. KO-2023]